MASDLPDASGTLMRTRCCKHTLSKASLSWLIGTILVAFEGRLLEATFADRAHKSCLRPRTPA